MDLEQLFYLVSIVFILGWFGVLVLAMVLMLILVGSTKKLIQKTEKLVEEQPAKWMIGMVPLLPLVVHEALKHLKKRK